VIIEKLENNTSVRLKIEVISIQKLYAHQEINTKYTNLSATCTDISSPGAEDILFCTVYCFGGKLFYLSNRVFSVT